LDVVIPHLLSFSLSFHTVEHATAHSPFRVETSDQHLSHHLILTLYFYLGRRPAEFQTFGLVRISCIALHYPSRCIFMVPFSRQLVHRSSCLGSDSYFSTSDLG